MQGRGAPKCKQSKVKCLGKISKDGRKQKRWKKIEESRENKQKLEI